MSFLRLGLKYLTIDHSSKHIGSQCKSPITRVYILHCLSMLYKVDFYNTLDCQCTISILASLDIPVCLDRRAGISRGLIWPVQINTQEGCNTGLLANWGCLEMTPYVFVSAQDRIFADVGISVGNMNEQYYSDLFHIPYK